MTVRAGRPGRPRSAAVDAAILDAIIDELIERGYPAMSVESIATRAGVAKTSVYRRWPTSADQALAAMRTFVQEAEAPPDGSVRDQLLFLLDAMRRTWNDPRYGAIARRAVSDAQAEPELFRLTRDRLIRGHVRQLNDVLRRAVEDGSLRADVDLGWARAMLVSPIMAAALTHRDRVGRAQLELIVDTVLRGLAP